MNKYTPEQQLQRIKELSNIIQIRDSHINNDGLLFETVTAKNGKTYGIIKDSSIIISRSVLRKKPSRHGIRFQIHWWFD